MNVPGNFEITNGYVCFRPVGEVSLQQATDMITDALTFACARKIRKLLVDTTELTGFDPPSVLQRLLMVERWAYGSIGVKLALVARSEMIDPRRFGTTAARNRGLIGDIFSSEPEAVTWLLGNGTQ